jgi:hypothetical protein
MAIKSEGSGFLRVESENDEETRSEEGQREQRVRAVFVCSKVEFPFFCFCFCFKKVESFHDPHLHNAQMMT